MVNLKVKFIVSIGKIGFWHISVIRAQLKYFGLSLRALRPLNSPQTLCWMTSRLTFPSKRVRQPHGLCYSELSPCVGEYGQTAHLHRGISEYGATGLGLHGRPSHGPVRPLVRPAIEYQRMENVIALPGMAVAAKNEVRSLLVVSKVPIDQAQSFALDTNSRSSVGLVRVLCQRHWNIAPEFIDAAPDVDEMLGRADAALIIGDPALRLRIRLDELEAKVPQGTDCCCGDDGEPLVKGVQTLFVYDIVQQWREMTGHACVLAIW